MINVTRSSMPDYDEYCKEIADLWDSRWLTNMGAKHNALRNALKDYLSVENVDLTTNGHMALELSLNAMGLKGEVITTPFSFASTTHAIVRNGLKPVFCDIDPITFTIDTNQIEKLVTDKTCAIMPVHVYGNVCNVEEIDRIARKHKLKVVYDAAHAFGVKYKGQGIASFGDVSCFSFHATKVFHTIEGGAVCYHDEEFGKRFFEMKDFGIHDPDTVNYVGTNAKLNEFCAAMGLCNLRHIDEEIKKRKRVVDRYRERLSQKNGLQLNAVQTQVQSNYAYFPIVVDESVFGATRDDILEALRNKDIGARKYFYPLITDFNCYRKQFPSTQTPVALSISKRVLTLPLYADLEIPDVDKICDVVLSVA